MVSRDTLAIIMVIYGDDIYPDIFIKVITMKNEISEADNQWLELFLDIYNETKPTIEKVSTLDSNGQPTDPSTFLEAYRILRPKLKSLEELSKPKYKELRKLSKDFNKTLSMCLKAAEMMEKFIDDTNAGAKFAGRMHLASVVGYVNYTQSYHQFVQKHLDKIGI